MSEQVTAESVGEWTLGERVRVDHRLVRQVHDRSRKVWVYEDLLVEQEGLVVGVRTLSNGKRDWESVDDFGGGGGYWEYQPSAYFRALLVVTDLRRRPFLVLHATKLDG